MRVIAGKFKGKTLTEPNSSLTRPTMDRVKQSLFDVLGFKTKGAKVLDLFAGSGSLGIESLSRGASSCTFVDNNVGAIKTIKENLIKLNLEEKVVQSNFDTVLKSFCGEVFDIVFLDPPYETQAGVEAIKLVLDLKLLNVGGVIVFETNLKDATQAWENLAIDFRELRYGQKFIYIITEKQPAKV